MKVTVTIVLNMLGFQRYRRELDENLKKTYLQWAVRYRSFVQRRFDRFSRGSGDWAPLKIRQGSILRDTNTLYSALAPAISAPPGSINHLLEDGIEVGYGGGSGHPGGPTVHQIAVWHQTGAGNYPAREMIVEPDAATIRGMVADMQRNTKPKG